jgi:parallel beta-helix repeat protein
MVSKVSVSVGNKSGDIIGNTNVAIQAAVDYASALGGGTVRVLEGEYFMYDSVRLKSGVSLIGDGPERTVLKKAACSKSTLKATSGYGESQIILNDPTAFQVGHGVAVYDDHAQGFLCTVGTIIEQTAEGTFLLNASMNIDCMVENNAMAVTIYPIVSASNCTNVTIKDIGIDGNREQNLNLNGCRGGGIFLHNTHNVLIQNCLVLNYNGDGISYQNCHDVIVDGCTSKGNAGLGIHPGSGSLRTIVRNCVATENDSIGFYFCWRVKHGLVENCEFSNNKGAGVSIGHRDTDNTILNNRILNNSNGGIEFRNEDVAHAPHRTRIEGNVILDNTDSSGPSGITIQGDVSDVLVKGNTIGNQTGAEKSVGVYVGKSAKNVTIENNSFSNVTQETTGKAV